MRISPPLSVDARDAETLRAWVQAGPAGSTAVRRARIVLLSAAGAGPSDIARDLGCSKQTVITWRERYRSEGVAGLRDAPRSGRPATVDPAAVIVRTLEGPPPALGAPRWSTRLLAAELGISNVAVANIWRSWGVRPGVAGRVRIATDPVLDAGVTALAGVYVDPPFRVLALVVGVDDGADPGPVAPISERPAVGPAFRELDAGMPESGGSPDAVGAFLAELATRCGPSGAADRDAARLAVLAATADEPLATVEQSGAVLHHVPADLSWARLVHVACLLASAGAEGRASVLALRDAVAAHPAGAPFAWSAPLLPAVCRKASNGERVHGLDSQ